MIPEIITNCSESYQPASSAADNRRWHGCCTSISSRSIKCTSRLQANMNIVQDSKSKQKIIRFLSRDLLLTSKRDTKEAAIIAKVSP